MFKQSPSTQNFAVTVIPELRPRMQWRVVEVTPLDGFRLSVRFVDGTEGTADLSGLIHSPHAGVFAQLTDPALFSQVFVEQGGVTWTGELDLAPDAMYTELKKNGEWILK